MTFVKRTLRNIRPSEMRCSTISEDICLYIIRFKGRFPILYSNHVITWYGRLKNYTLLPLTWEICSYFVRSSIAFARTVEVIWTVCRNLYFIVAEIFALYGGIFYAWRANNVDKLRVEGAKWNWSAMLIKNLPISFHIKGLTLKTGQSVVSLINKIKKK